MEIDFMKINDRMIQGNNKIISKPVNSLDSTMKSFADYLKDGMDWANDTSLESREMTKKFMLGEVENAHDVTIAAEKASLAMKTVTTIRKKIIDAYKEVMQSRL